MYFDEAEKRLFLAVGEPPSQTKMTSGLTAENTVENDKKQ